MYRTKVSPEEKIKLVVSYIHGKGSIDSNAKEIGVNKRSFQDWVRIYQSMGPEGLLKKSKAKHYSKETKRAAVEDYLSGEGSQAEICKRYGIFSQTQLQNWLKQYNGHKEFRTSNGQGSEIYMTKGKATSYEERIEIVGFCIENGKDYVRTIEKYGVSYQQIYAWVRKYEELGVKGLVDKRGKRKTISEMTEIERLRAENRLLQAKIKDKEMEIDLLKKLEEIERGYR